MSVKAKFVCRTIEDQPAYGVKVIRMEAVIDGSDENKEWSKYTPSGNLSMNITNPAAFEQFEEGKEYYLTFDPVPVAIAADAGGSNPPGSQPGKP